MSVALFTMLKNIDKQRITVDRINYVTGIGNGAREINLVLQALARCQSLRCSSKVLVRKTSFLDEELWNNFVRELGYNDLLTDLYCGVLLDF